MPVVRRQVLRRYRPEETRLGETRLRQAQNQRDEILRGARRGKSAGGRRPQSNGRARLVRRDRRTFTIHTQPQPHPLFRFVSISSVLLINYLIPRPHPKAV